MNLSFLRINRAYADCLLQVIKHKPKRNEIQIALIKSVLFHTETLPNHGK